MGGVLIGQIFVIFGGFFPLKRKVDRTARSTVLFCFADPLEMAVETAISFPQAENLICLEHSRWWRSMHYVWNNLTCWYKTLASL